METEFKQLLQIGIIVRSVDKAVRYYEEMLGMGPWEVSYMRGISRRRMTSGSTASVSRES